MPRKPQKPLTKAALHLKACQLLAVPPMCILNVVPNCAKTKYFIHWQIFTTKGKPVYHTELVAAKELEKQKL
jgi:hypothetical protein